MAERSVVVVAHTGRPDAMATARHAVGLLDRAGLTVRMTADEVRDLDAAVRPDGRAAGIPVQVLAAGERPAGCELVVVLGGDGSVLRGAEVARAWDVPLLGVNLGHVGFLAEAEVADLEQTVHRVVARDYTVEERMTLAVDVRDADGHHTATGWAVNEASIEKAAAQRILELVVSVDDQPVSRWACDGLVAATPTGSTAYAFSAGGPVVWPEVQALLIVPLSAHALFSRPLVIAPGSPIGVDLLATSGTAAVLWCDGRRRVDLPAGASVRVRRDSRPVRFARLAESSFTSRLVNKFDLPVAGWRGRAERRSDLPR